MFYIKVSFRNDENENVEYYMGSKTNAFSSIEMIEKSGNKYGYKTLAYARYRARQCAKSSYLKNETFEVVEIK